ncbi:MAG TPA: hypothetical protein VEO95_06210, partial [Chthoniobacteraceae bacterium]|nr:hypothetical protein [Chthoniobacteraceae bacterium]
CRQRLETPVIYFYSAQPRTVDVAVTFPSGTITEWFPRDTPAARNDRTAPALRWSGVQIVPRGDAAAGALPLEKSGSHYYAARETDSDFVRVAAGAECETEKFLFYRGVGNFDAPLKVTSAETGGAALTLENCGKEELGILFVCEVRPPVADSGPQFVVTFQRIEKLPAGKVQTVKLIGAASSEDSRSDLAAQLRDALTAAGLYRAEAAAMVRTWEDSWLGEPGVRVLYILPRAWTDGILPLQFTPAPRELSRVMVGRAEVLMPAAERALATELQRFRSRDQGERATAIGNIRALGFGRFLEAAVRRFAATHSGDRELSNAGWQVLELASARPPVATHP